MQNCKHYIFILNNMRLNYMPILSVTYASSPSSDLLISTLEFNNDEAGVIRLAQSFNDVMSTTELSETVTFIESAWSFNWASSCEIK